MKKQTFALFTALALLACSSSSLASDGGGSSGGGNSVVCFDDPSIPPLVRQNSFEIPDSAIPHIASIEALDLYEAKLPRGLNGQTSEIIPLLAGENEDTYLNRVENRFENVIPAIPQILKAWRHHFTGRNVILQPHGLKRVDDAAEVNAVDSEHCVLATMATQYNLNSRAILNLDSRLFNHPKHSVLSRAIILLHEYLYAEARNLGQTQSRYTRALVGMLISQNDGQTLQSLLKSMKELGFVGSNPRSTWSILLSQIKSEIADDVEKQISNVENRYAEDIREVLRFAYGKTYHLDCLETTFSNCRSALAEYWGMQEVFTLIDGWLNFEANAVLNVLLERFEANKKLINSLPLIDGVQKELIIKHYEAKLAQIRSILKGYQYLVGDLYAKHNLQKRHVVEQALSSFIYDIDFVIPAAQMGGNTK